MIQHICILAMTLALWSSKDTKSVLDKSETTTWYTDATLRLDYTFAGTSETQSIYLDRMKSSEGWYGKRHNMNTIPLQGNGTITVTDHTSKNTLYRHSFSTLFQEHIGHL